MVAEKLVVTKEVLLPPMGKSSRKIDCVSISGFSFSANCRLARNLYKLDSQYEWPDGEEDKQRFGFRENDGEEDSEISKEEEEESNEEERGKRRTKTPTQHNSPIRYRADKQ